MVTVGHLMKELSKLPQDMPVAMSSDGEGISFKPFCDGIVASFDFSQLEIYGDEEDPSKDAIVTYVLFPED